MAAFSFSQERDMMFGLRSTGHSRQSVDLPSAMFSAIIDDDSLQLLACLEVAAEATERDGEGKDERAIPSLIQTLVSHPLPSHLPPPPDFEPSGSPLHLCCVLDRPVHLALLLIAGGDVEARHGGFRRSVIHESCCSGEGGCLDVLLEVATSHVSEEEDQEQEQGREEGGEQPLPPVSFHTPSRPKSPLGHLPEGSPTSVSQFGGEGEAADFKSKLYLARQLLMKRPNFNPISDPNPDKDVPIHITLMRSMSVPASVSSSLNPHLVQSATDGHGNTPLHWASFKNLPSQVASLLRIGADPNFRAHPSGWTPLHDAAYSDAARAMKLLLSSGANVDSKAASGATPLCFAAQEDCPDCCDLLLSSGASANVRCEGGEGRFSGYTPLHYTAHYNAHRSAKVLVTLGAEMEIRDEMGRLPIHVATSRGSCDVLKELLKAGAQAVIKGDAAPSVPVSPNLSAVPAPPAAPQGENIAQALPIEGPTTQHQLVNLPPPPPSPPLTSLLPHSPVRSSKPWNCITQLQIDACSSLITSADSGWSPKTHHVFTPTDRKGILEVLRVGKRLEQTGTGLHVLDLWPFILGFCGRGWFLDEQFESGQGTPKAEPVKVTGYSFFKTGEDYDEGSEEEEYDTEDEDSVRDDRLPPPPPKTERVVEEMEPFSLEGAAVRGQPLGVQRLISWSDFRDDDDDDDDDEDRDDVDVEAPLMAKGGEGGEAKGGDKRSIKASRLWQEDTTAQEKAAMAQMSQLRPLGKALKAKKYMFQQTVMRFLSSLIFAHVLVSFQVVCVFYTQCFDVADDPGNWHIWDTAAIPVMFIVGGMIIPFCLTLIEQKDLTKLKLGAAVQFLTSIGLCILCGVAYGMWDSENGIKNNIKANFNDNDYTLPYDAATNPIFNADDIFYYQLQKTGDLDVDTQALADTLMEKMQWIFACNLIGGVLFLAQFSFSMSYLCHVYYGPQGAAI